MDQTKTAGRGSGKRERLVEGAQGAFHEQGVERTTLADVASRADVPLGNVYYYFKTKDQLVERRSSRTLMPCARCFGAPSGIARRALG